MIEPTYPTSPPRSSGERSPAASLSAADLDRVLDVPAADFDAVAEGWIDWLDRREISIAFEPTPSTSTTRPSRTTSLLSMFLGEIARIRPLSRSDELRLARRYDFVRRRLLRALSGGPGGTSARSDLLAARRAEALAVRNEIVERSLRLVPTLVRPYRGLGVPTVDLLQEGCAGLLRAVETFDWRRGVRFGTYANFWAQNRILNLLYRTGRTVRLPVYLLKAWKRVKRAQRRDPEASPASLAEQAGLPDFLVLRATRAARPRTYSLSSTRGNEEGASLEIELADPREDAPFPEEPGLRERIRRAVDGLPARERFVLVRRFGLDGGPVRTLVALGRLLGVSHERVRQIQERALARLRRAPRRQILEPLFN